MRLGKIGSRHEYTIDHTVQHTVKEEYTLYAVG